jgi:hypothetical protein
MRRAVLVAAVVLVLAAACSDDAKDEANDLEVGDCVAGDVRTKDDEVRVVDCDEEHVVQAFGSVEAPDGDFPGDEELAAIGYDACQQGDLFETFVGIPYVESSRIWASWLVPDADDWEDGDRTVVCVAHTEDHDPTTGSYEGAGLPE